MVSSSKRKAIAALLLDRFHLSIDQFARLTDRQIFELYLHARNKDGGIDLAEPLPPDPVDEPEEPPSFEADLAALDMARDALRMRPEVYADLRAKLEAKYGRVTATAG